MTSATAASTWVFPAAFTYPADPQRLVCTGAVGSSPSAPRVILMGGVGSGTSISFNVTDLTGARQAATVHLQAIGRWF